VQTGKEKKRKDKGIIKYAAISSLNILQKFHYNCACNKKSSLSRLNLDIKEEGGTLFLLLSNQNKRYSQIFNHQTLKCKKENIKRNPKYMKDMVWFQENRKHQLNCTRSPKQQ